ncbi:hypothetical protein GCM10009347_20260 [Shewanella algicola]|nr:hypothetical protein GCM10009347_20260 [Shewanella algicola]
MFSATAPALLYILHPCSRTSKILLSSIEGTETRLAGGAQTVHFFVALSYKGITIISTMRLKLDSLSDSDWSHN